MKVMKGRTEKVERERKYDSTYNNHIRLTLLFIPKRFHAQDPREIQSWKHSISNTVKIIFECNTPSLLISISKILFVTD